MRVTLIWMTSLCDGTLSFLGFYSIFLKLKIQMYSKYNTVGEHPHIPKQAFLFIPHRQQNPKQRDDFRIGQQKDIRRLLFEGWAQETYTPYELEKLKELDDYIARKNIKIDERWDKSWRIRWHLSTGCKIKKTIEDMQKFIDYQNSVQELNFTSNVEKYLKQGIYYMAGRDSHYRPIFVFDVEKVIKLDMSDEIIIETQTYFFQYALRNLLIPGQVENWVTVIDAAQTGLTSLIGSMKKSFGFLSDTYRSRMFVCYVCRVPSSLSFIWSIVKRFLQEETVKKINFFDEQKIEPLMEFCNPEQVEEKFGGTLPNLKEGDFWPPREVSENYQCSKDPTKLISKEQYSDYYNKKILYNTKFQQSLLQTETSSPISPELTSTQYKENKQHHTVKQLDKQFRKQFDHIEHETYQISSLYMPRPPNYKHLVRISGQMEGNDYTPKQ